MCRLTEHEKAILYEALVSHDGQSLRPDWDRDQQKELSAALDKLRQEILPENLR